MDSQQPDSGPVARPSSRAVEAPRAAAPALRPVHRRVGVAIAGLAALALVSTLVIRNVAGQEPERARAVATPAPTATAATPLATPAAGVTGAAGAADELALVGGVGPASQVAMSPTGDRVLAIRERGVDIWRLDGSRVAWLAVDGDRIDGASWATDGRRVLVWGPDGTVRLWNAETGAMIQTVQAGMGVVAHAELTDATHALTVSPNGTRRTWDLKSGEVRVQRGGSDPDHGGAAAPVRINAITPDSQWRAFVDASGSVRLARVI